MNRTQVHRGPDGAGTHALPELGFAMAMRRLAIIDREGGAQPRVSEDGRHALVYNGEIFNAPALRRELEAQGVRFTSDHSDTEVLFQLLIHRGEDCLAGLNGMFAFAFLDTRTGVLLLARDHFGIKPLHYSQSDGRFAFASEIKSLLALPWIGRDIDPAFAWHYMSLMYGPTEGSAYAQVKRLPPGHVLRYDLGSGAIETRAFWRLWFEPDHGLSRAEWREAIRAELGAAVERWAWSDVPVAVSLSGGLDSSAIAALAARRGVPVQAFSLGFSGKEAESLNELPLARSVARKWGIALTEIVLEPEALIAALPDMVRALDEPYGGGLPSWFVFKGMGEQVRVGLTGTGGDELFGNYGKWTGIEARWLGRFGRRDASAVDRPLFEQHLFRRYYYLADEAKRALFLDPPDAAMDTGLLLFRRFQEAAQGKGANLRDAWAGVDIATQLPEEFLLMTDRFSMAHSLEARTPFLDQGLVDLVRRIPADQRTQRRDLKGLLREAVAPLLPPELLSAPKRGFVIPMGEWLRGPLRTMLADLLSGARLARQGLFRADGVARLVNEHLSERADHTRPLWALLMYQLWADVR